MDATSRILNTDEECKSAKVVCKRRSSVFHTRFSMCDQSEDNNVRNELTSNVDEGERNDVEISGLNEYIERLKQERKDWQREYKNRKAQRKDLTKKKANLENQRQTLDINVLTESERAFLIARPNYEYICRNSQKLLDMTLKISILNQLVCKSNQRFIDRMERNISRATKTVINMSEL